jgi:hypothetical protein
VTGNVCALRDFASTLRRIVVEGVERTGISG